MKKRFTKKYLIVINVTSVPLKQILLRLSAAIKQKYTNKRNLYWKILFFSYSIILRFESAFIQKHVASHNRQSKTKGQFLYCNRGDCQKAFAQISLLEEHVRRHDNILTNCNYCPWALIDHMNHHFKIRPFKCSFCDLSFYNIANRGNHERDIHEKIFDRYKCEQCPFTTHSSSIFNQHRRKIHF